MERPQESKSSHRQVNYEAESSHRGKTCSRCKHFIDSDPPACETVASPIAAGGWCERFALDPEKLKLGEYRKYRESGDGKKLERDGESAAYRASRDSGYES